MAEEGAGGRGRGERGGQRKGPEREGEGRKREGPHDPLAWGPQCLNPALVCCSIDRAIIPSILLMSALKIRYSRYSVPAKETRNE